MATAIGAYATAATLQALIGGGQTFDAADTTLMGSICDRVNAYIEETTGRVLAPVASAVYTMDGNGRDRIYFPRGIRAVSLLEIAYYTGASYTTITEYFLRPSAQDRPPAWPATWLVLSNLSVTYRRFPVGLDNVRMTATTGFDAIPDDITNLALVVAQRWWNQRQSGYQSVGGVDEQGRSVVERFFSLPEYQTLKSYTLLPSP